MLSELNAGSKESEYDSENVAKAQRTGGMLSNRSLFKYMREKEKGRIANTIVRMLPKERWFLLVDFSLFYCYTRRY